MSRYSRWTIPGCRLVRTRRLLLRTSHAVRGKEGPVTSCDVGHMAKKNITSRDITSRHATSHDITSHGITWARVHVDMWTCGHAHVAMRTGGHVDMCTCAHVDMSHLCKTCGSARTPFLHAILHGALGSGCSSVSHKVRFFGDRGHSVLPRIRAFLRGSLGALCF